MCAFSASSETRNNGQTNPNKTLKNRKRKQRKREKDKKRFQKATESRKQHIKNLSHKQFTDEQIALLSRGLKFIPTPMTNEDFIRRNLLRLLQTFAGLHWSIFFFVKKMKVRQLRYHFPKKVSKNIKMRASY